MALKSTIFKAELQVSDLDRPYYGTHALTLARHPSETDERMMVRLFAFALYADERLEFGRGLSTEGDPALWRKDHAGAIELWIDVGQPDERDVRKACGRAGHVVVVSYGGRTTEMWWAENRQQLGRLGNLTILNLPLEASQALARLAGRNMCLQCTIQEGQVWIGTERHNFHFEMGRWLIPF